MNKMTLTIITNDFGLSYCITIYDSKKNVYANKYISYAEFLILKECFEKLSYKIVEKDFRK